MDVAGHSLVLKESGATSHLVSKCALLIHGRHSSSGGGDHIDSSVHRVAVQGTHGYLVVVALAQESYGSLERVEGKLPGGVEP